MADEKKDLSIELQIEGLQKVSSDLRSMVTQLNEVARAVNPLSQGLGKAFGDKDLQNLNKFTQGLGRLDKILESVGEKADRMGARVSRALGSIQGSPGGDKLFEDASNDGRKPKKTNFSKGFRDAIGTLGMGTQTGDMIGGMVGNLGPAGGVVAAAAAVAGAVLNTPSFAYNLDKTSRENNRFLDYAGLRDPGQATAGALSLYTNRPGGFERGAERLKEDIFDAVRNPLFLFDSIGDSDKRRSAAVDRRLAERRMEEEQELGSAFTRASTRAAVRSPLERLYGTAGVSNVFGQRSPYSVDTMQGYANAFESAGATGAQFGQLTDMIAGDRGYGMRSFMESGMRRGGMMSSSDAADVLGSAGLGINGASDYERYRVAGDLSANFINSQGLMPGIQGQADILGKSAGLISAAGELMPGSSAAAQGQIAGLALNQNMSALNSSPVMEAQMSQLSALGITNVIDQGEILAYLKAGRETEAANLIKQKARGVVDPGAIEGIIKAPTDYLGEVAGMFGRDAGQVMTALSGSVEQGTAAQARLGEAGDREMRFTETGGVSLGRQFSGATAQGAAATSGDKLEAARAEEGRVVENLIQAAGETMATVIAQAAQVWVTKVFEQSVANRLIGQNALPPGYQPNSLRPSGAKR